MPLNTKNICDIYFPIAYVESRSLFDAWNIPKESNIVTASHQTGLDTRSMTRRSA